MLSYVNCSRRAAAQVQNAASQILRPAANRMLNSVPSVRKQIRSCHTCLRSNAQSCGSNYSFKRPSSTLIRCNMIRRGCILTPLGSRSFVSSSSPRSINDRVAAVEDAVESDEELTNGAATNDAQIHVTPDKKLLVNGKVLLSDVPHNVVVTQHGSYGAFIGASSDKSKSRHVFSLGVFKDHRFMCCFRFSLWWMTQRMGTLGRDIPTETQFMLVELNKDSPGNGDQDATQYAVLLPLLDGQFRASLQGDAAKNNLELCIESGDASIETQGGLHSVFLHTGTNPFEVISEAVKAVEAHLRTFHRRENKKMPGILDWFGWCTWDAFYTDVTADGVRQGLKSLEEGGTPAKFLIIDDGWQSISSEKSKNEDSQDAKRLSDVRENFKFQKDGKEGVREEDPKLGLHHLVREIKQNHKLEHVYVWHAITGYWGGIKPEASGMEQYQGDLHYPLHSEGLLSNHPAIGVDHLTINGFGLPHPNKVFQFYDDLHSYLAAAGVDGVKVDVQNILETLGTGMGGRVSITKHYQEALERSVEQNFPNNGCIACMSHNIDGLYSIKNTGIVRASDDFFPRDPASHTIHIAAVSYNSLFLGEFMQPDWDMFHSLHPVAEYHAAARAISGGPVYVSDKPGNHDFSLLSKLVLPDGSILRAQLPGRPTRDCLFTDPARDGKSLLKIWNLNKYTGVVGVFNCQGAGWCKVEKKMIVHDSDPKTVSSTVYASDVDSLNTLNSCDIDPAIVWNGESAIYSQKQGELVCLAPGAGIPVSLNVLEYDIFTVSPVKRFLCGTVFAPIGLLEMFNSGGAISDLHYSCEQKPTIEMTIHGCGKLGAYSSCRPTDVKVNGVTSSFSYDDNSHMLKVPLPQLQNLWHKVQFTL